MSCPPLWLLIRSRWSKRGPGGYPLPGPRKAMRTKDLGKLVQVVQVILLLREIRERKGKGGRRGERKKKGIEFTWTTWTGRTTLGAKPSISRGYEVQVRSRPAPVTWTTWTATWTDESKGRRGPHEPERARCGRGLAGRRGHNQWFHDFT